MLPADTRVRDRQALHCSVTPARYTMERFCKFHMKLQLQEGRSVLLLLPVTTVYLLP